MLLSMTQLQRHIKIADKPDRARALQICACVLAAALLYLPSAAAQDWQTGVTQPNTTTLTPGQPAPATANAARRGVKFVAFLTERGQRIDKGVVWRIYKFEGPNRAGAILRTVEQATPTVNLQKGRYIVNASFGRAHVTREIKVLDPTRPEIKRFVLNAGGLRVRALLESDANKDVNAVVRYDIYTDRDQLDNRQLVLSGVRPGLIVRLNSGIYHIVSKYGSANATISSDVTIEPGKLTEATVTHSAAKVRFKLVTRSGGEALPATQWQIKTSNGDLVKNSVGALPTHILAPGAYTVVGISDGQTYQKSFTVTSGTMIDVEVIKR